MIKSRITDAWVAQHLRNTTPFGEGPRYLIRDNDSKWVPSFAAVAQSIEVLRTTYRAPKADVPTVRAICERFLGSPRRECSVFCLISGERHLHHTSNKYVRYLAMPDLIKAP